MVEDDADAVDARVKIVLSGLVKVGLVDAKLVGRGLLRDVGAMAGIVGPLADGGKSRLKNRNSGARNRLAVFINDREDDWSARGGSLGTRED